MITNLRLQNYKNHRETSFEFGRLTALVGPNSSGKTSILEAIARLGSTDKKTRLRDLFDSDEEAAACIRKGTYGSTASVTGNQPDTGEWKFQISLKASGLHKATKASTLTIDSGGDKTKINGKVGGIFGHEKRNSAPPWVINEISSIQFLSPSSRLLKLASFTKEIPPKISEHGENLASVIAHHRLSSATWNQQLVKRLQQVIPTVEDLRVQQVHVSVDESGRIKRKVRSPKGQYEGLNKADELTYDFRGAHGVLAEHVSEGTLFATLIFAALMQYPDSDAPKTLLLDDIDQGLHPKAQRDLIRVLRKMIEEEPDLQVIFSTHSPYVVDEMEADEVYLLNTDKDGAAHAKKLSEHPDAERALEVLTTGEFWSAEGEEWVVDQDERV